MIHTDKKHSVRFAKHLLEAHLNTSEANKIKLEGKSAETLEALFPGTHGDNAHKMYELMALAVEGFVENRKKYYPKDPDYIDNSVTESAGFKTTTDMMEVEYVKLIERYH